MRKPVDLQRLCEETGTRLVAHKEDEGEIVKSFYGVDEALLLARFVAMAPRAAVVELGTCNGMSAQVLLEGADGRLVILIDPWDKVPDWDFMDVEEAKNRVRRLVARHPNSLAIQAFGEEFRGFWNIPIGFLHVDDDHIYTSTFPNLEVFGPHVVSGGFIAMHDWNAIDPPRAWYDWPGHVDYRDFIDQRRLRIWRKQ